MSEDLSETFSDICRGKTAFLSIGNIDRGDDGVGVVLGNRLREAGLEYVFDGGTLPENVVPELRDGGFDSVVFVDAVDFADEPGSVMIMNAHEVATQYPQVSTHKLSLGTVAKLISDNDVCRVWLLGIQPSSISLNTEGLSSVVDKTANLLVQKIVDVMTEKQQATERICN